MKTTIFIVSSALLLLVLSGCWEANVCSSNEECADFKCDLDCRYERVCVKGKCECHCIQTEKECDSDKDCELKCGIPPNKALCKNGECICKYQCEKNEDCKDFPCLLYCHPNYNYCEDGACTCACEQEPQKFSPWEVKELKEELKGKIITVIGTVQKGKTSCSEEDCNGECCHECSASLELFSGKGDKSGFIKLSGKYNGKEILCKGNECELDCWPLKRENTYSVRGTWKFNEKRNEYFFEPIDFSLLERGKPRFKSNKTEYIQGETIKFSLDYSRKLFSLSLEPPTIFKKINGKWKEFETSCGCEVACNNSSPVCEKNILECNPPNQCTEINQNNTWQWQQEYCELKEIDCKWQTKGIGGVVYCSQKLKAEPGTYKVKFTYLEECSEKEKFTAYSNEFTIK